MDIFEYPGNQPGSSPETGVNSPRPDEPLSLGVDIGTTSVSAQIVSLRTGEAVYTRSIDHNAAVSVEGYPDAFAEDGELLIQRAVELVRSALDAFPGIASVGFSGAMHGIVCLDADMRALSPLYTWQNGFGERSIGGKNICDRFAEETGVRTPTGYGFVTLYALRILGLLPDETVQFAPIADAAAARLCGRTAPLLHPTMAASLGLWNLDRETFLPQAKTLAGKLRLPGIRGGYSLIGELEAKGGRIPVAAAIGDNQAGVFGSLNSDDMVLVNIGTSGQVSLVDGTGEGEQRPYFDGKRLLSGSSLCGGSAYEALAGLVSEVLSAFAVEPVKQEVYAYLNHLAENPPEDPLRISTRFSGTRADPTLRCSIDGLSLASFDMHHLADGILRGMIEELHTAFLAMTAPDEKRRTVVSGNAMRRCPGLRSRCAECFGTVPLLPVHTEEAAFGAALYAAVSARLLTREQTRKLIRYRED